MVVERRLTSGTRLECPGRLGPGRRPGRRTARVYCVSEHQCRARPAVRDVDRRSRPSGVGGLDLDHITRRTLARCGQGRYRSRRTVGVLHQRLPVAPRRYPAHVLARISGIRPSARDRTPADLSRLLGRPPRRSLSPRRWGFARRSGNPILRATWPGREPLAALWRYRGGSTSHRRPAHVRTAYAAAAARRIADRRLSPAVPHVRGIAAAGAELASALSRQLHDRIAPQPCGGPRARTRTVGNASGHFAPRAQRLSRRQPRRPALQRTVVLAGTLPHRRIVRRRRWSRRAGAARAVDHDVGAPADTNQLSRSRRRAARSGLRKRARLRARHRRRRTAADRSSQGWPHAQNDRIVLHPSGHHGLRRAPHAAPACGRRRQPAHPEPSHRRSRDGKWCLSGVGVPLPCTGLRTGARRGTRASRRRDRPKPIAPRSDASSPNGACSASISIPPRFSSPASRCGWPRCRPASR